MPELPEVETTVRGLHRVLVGKQIQNVWTSYNSLFHAGKDNIKNPRFFNIFQKAIDGAMVTNVTRRAKNILIHLDTQQTILIHMKMTGHLLYGHYEYHKKTDTWATTENGPLKDPFNQHIRLVFILNDGKHLAFSDMRKFAKVTLLDTKTLKDHKDLLALGPEPLDHAFTLETFSDRIKNKPTGRIKQVLMDQHVISGIGNIYSDEILWEACVHPEKRVRNITDDEMKQMFDAMFAILKKSIRLGGDSMSDFRNIEGEKGGFHPHHNAYQQHGKKCTRPECAGTIQKMKVGGRSAHFCNTHQRAPRG